MSKKKVTFNEQVFVCQLILGIFLVAKKKPIVTDEEIRQRHSLFQQKRKLMKQWMHLNHLERKARRESKNAAKRQKTEL